MDVFAVELVDKLKMVNMLKAKMVLLNPCAAKDYSRIFLVDRSDERRKKQVLCSLTRSFLIRHLKLATKCIL